jgi:hypothetical protein
MISESNIIKAALQESEPFLLRLPAAVANGLRLALSIVSSPHPSAAEMTRELGDKWVVARRTKRAVERYGEHVKFCSPRQYDAAQRRALWRRVHGAALPGAVIAELFPGVGGDRELAKAAREIRRDVGQRGQSGQRGQCEHQNRPAVQA